MHRWIVTALGKDRPGIVAGVTRVLYALGCNLEDSAMTRLEGEFAIMLIFSCSAAMRAERVHRAFEPLAKRLHLTMHLKPLTKLETQTPSAPGRPYLISVYGADRPGIVFRVTDALAKQRVNVTDVETHRSGAPTHRGERSLYLMLLEVEVPARLSLAALEGQLQRLAKRLGVEVSVRPAEAEVL